MSSTDTPNPIQYFIDQGITIIKIASNSTYSLFLTNNGQVYAIGENIYRVLANGNTTSQYTNPVFCSQLQNYYIIDIAAGYYTSFF